MKRDKRNVNNPTIAEFDGRCKHHKRLYLATEDFKFCSYYVSYLLKHALYNRPWERRWTVYQRQSAFSLALVVSYCRPFNSGNPISEKFLRSFTTKQKKMHDKIRIMRNKMFAHSDLEEFGVRPVGGGKWIASILSFPPYMISRSELTMISSMLRKLIKAVTSEQRKLERYLVQYTPPGSKDELSPESLFHTQFQRPT